MQTTFKAVLHNILIVLGEQKKTLFIWLKTTVIHDNLEH